jgi:hypothetical protein
MPATPELCSPTRGNASVSSSSDSREGLWARWPRPQRRNHDDGGPGALDDGDDLGLLRGGTWNFASANCRSLAAAVSPDKKPGKERAPSPPLRGAPGARTSVGTTLMRSSTSSTIATTSAGPMLAGRRPWHARHVGRRSCHEPCHASSKRHHSVGISAPPDSAPGGIRTHTKRILRAQDIGHCGLYLRLCPHRVLHQPHQRTTVDVISSHEPCHVRLLVPSGSIRSLSPAKAAAPYDRRISSTDAAPIVSAGQHRSDVARRQLHLPSDTTVRTLTRRSPSNKPPRKFAVGAGTSG